MADVNLKLIRYKNISFSFGKNTVIKHFNLNAMQKDEILFKRISEGMI